MARILTRALGAGILILLSFFAFSAQAQSLGARDFVIQMSDVEISPDGRYLSMLQPVDGRNALVIYPLAGGQPATVSAGQRLPGENLEIVAQFWPGPDRVVMVVEWSGERNYYGRRVQVREQRLMSVTPDGNNVQVLFENDQGGLSSSAQQGQVISILQQDPDGVLVLKGTRGGDVWRRDAYRVDVNTGRAIVVANGTANTNSFFTNARGEVIGRVDYIDGDFVILVREPGSLSWREIHRYEWFTEGEQTFSPIVALDNGRRLYFYSSHEGRIGLYSFDLENGGEFVREFLHDQVDVGGFDFSREEDRPISISYTVDLTETHFFDEEEGRIYRRLNNALPGATAFEVSSTLDGSKRIFMDYGPGDPPIFYLVDLEGGSVSEVGQMLPRLNPGNLGDVQAISYPARDGTMIPAYLTLPPGVDASDGPLPFVLYPHGGPQQRDSQGYDPIRQYIATRGYAVLQPNFRGSTGYGTEWQSAGFEQWGGLMQTDLLDGVQYLIDQGIADPSRMCFVGWSYSAYAALYAAVDTPDMFNCYIGINGVYDLPDLQGDLRTLGADQALDYWARTMGSDEAALARVSPARRAASITRPVLIIASEEDRTAPPQESRRMITAMQAARVPYESEFYPYGDHSMSYEDSWVGTLEHIGSFLAANINR